jgi:hypothetical protein
VSQARFLEEAESEFLKEVQYYGGVQADGAERFRAAIEDATARALAFPMAGLSYLARTRRAFVKGYDERMVTWDESKRRRNIKEHGFDFADCETIFDGPTVSWDDDRVAYGEQRINLLGWLHGTVVHMTYTERGDEPHIISLRKAEKHEIRHYVKEVSR